MSLKVFVFAPADILSMSSSDTAHLIKFLNNDLVKQFQALFDDEEFQSYKNIPELEGTYDRIVETIGNHLHPLALSEKLKNFIYPALGDERTMEEVIKMDFNSSVESLSILNQTDEDFNNLVELLEEILAVLPYAQRNYLSRTKKEWDEFCNMCSQLTVRSMLISEMFGIPRNENLMSELMANASFLYSSKSTRQATGLSYLIGKEAEIRTMYNGFQWQKYLRDNNLPREVSYSYV